MAILARAAAPPRQRSSEQAQQGLRPKVTTSAMQSGKVAEQARIRGVNAGINLWNWYVGTDMVADGAHPNSACGPGDSAQRVHSAAWITLVLGVCFEVDGCSRVDPRLRALAGPLATFFWDFFCEWLSHAAGRRACHRFRIDLATRDQQKFRAYLLAKSPALPGPRANYLVLAEMENLPD